MSGEKPYDDSQSGHQSDSANNVQIQNETSKGPEQSEKELTWRSAMTTAGAASATFVSVGFLNAFGVFQNYYSQDILRDKTAFQISWLGSFANFSVFVFGLPAGWVADRTGPMLPIAFGAVCMVVAIMMVSLCKAYWEFFLAQGLLLGLGMSCVAIPATGMIPKYFTKNRATATGVTIGGSSIGGVIWPIVFDQLFHHDGLSFGWSMRIAGFIMLPLLIFSVLATRPPAKAKEESKQQEEGEAEKEKEKEQEQEQEQPDGSSSPKVNKLAALSQPPFILLCIGLLLFNLGFNVPIFYISVYGVDHGFSEDLSYYLISILNAASLFGRVLPGFIADKFGRFNLITICATSAGVVAFCWSSATSHAGIIVWAAAYGFTSGAILSLQFACATSLAGKETAATVVGATMTAVSLATLFGTPISGEILNYGWGPLTWYTGATVLSGAAFLGLSRFVQNKDPRAKL